MEWGDVRYFLALARAGSLSAASRRLGVEHTTVARRVDALEAALGTRLFDRLPRGWRLTAEGERLVDDAGRLEEEALAFARRAAGGTGVAGPVAVSAPPFLANHFLAPRLGPVLAAHPGLVLTLIGEKRAAMLGQREADLVLRLSRPAEHGAVARRVGTMAFGLYAAPSYLAGRRPEDWVFLGDDESAGELPQHRWLLAFAGSRPLVLRSNDMTTLFQAARAGIGIAALPCFVGEGDPGLACVEADQDGVGSREIWIGIHEDLRRSPRLRLAMDAIAAIFARERRLLEGAGAR
ncbi:LysR family transcriptional regulator [Inquilinus limosus]|uniref:LysR family transcriptional regulator n=1 Tax=Inquilinus limosus TaxID=171674 RepID=A0A211ZNW5_9PROT|nr:LysR family transcriptional regulator [Inquilinus limosus]OWJ66854.1 LysR family transcriptional regulator [Inquilinus limosus]